MCHLVVKVRPIRSSETVGVMAGTWPHMAGINIVGVWDRGSTVVLIAAHIKYLSNVHNVISVDAASRGIRLTYAMIHGPLGHTHSSLLRTEIGDVIIKLLRAPRNLVGGQ